MRKFLLSMALVLLSGATMAQNYSERVLTADDLNAITKKTAIAIKCVQNQGNQNDYYNGSGRSAGFDSNKIFYWVPVENETGYFYIMNGNEQYMQQPTGDNSTDFYTFGEKGNAAKLHAINPTSSGTTNPYKFSEYNLVYNDTETNRNELVRIALHDDSKWMNLFKNSTTGTGIWTVMRVYAVVEKTPAISKQLTASELMEKTEPTYIAIKNISYTNNRWFVGNTGDVPYSKEEFTEDAVFVWEPVTAGSAGSYRLKKLDGTYMAAETRDNTEYIIFSTVDNAVTFTATNPTSAGTGSTKFNGDGDSNPYITGSDDANLVRFVKGSNWINVQNGAGGTPIYNTGEGGWTIHYVYELTMTDTYEASITGAGYATFYVPANVEIPEGVKAYYITSEDVKTDYVSMTEITTGVIPANTAVILEGTEGNYTFNVAGSDATAVSGNLLKGTFTSMYIEGVAYVLSNPSEGVGLYKTEMTEMQLSNATGKKSLFLNNANKAYLPASAVPAAAQASNGFRFGEGTTGIDEITENRVQSTVIYDLTGRRVEAITAPGIYIVGGKKVLVK